MTCPRLQRKLEVELPETWQNLPLPGAPPPSDLQAGLEGDFISS